MTTRRSFLIGAATCTVATAHGLLKSGASHAAASTKVLRVAMFDIDTLDPQQYADDPSFQVIQVIFEPGYEDRR